MSEREIHRNSNHSTDLFTRSIIDGVNIPPGTVVGFLLSLSHTISYKKLHNIVAKVGPRTRHCFCGHCNIVFSFRDVDDARDFYEDLVLREYYRFDNLRQGYITLNQKRISYWLWKQPNPPNSSTDMPPSHLLRSSAPQAVPQCETCGNMKIVRPLAPLPSGEESAVFAPRFVKYRGQVNSIEYLHTAGLLRLDSSVWLCLTNSASTHTSPWLPRFRCGQRLHCYNVWLFRRASLALDKEQHKVTFLVPSDVTFVEEMVSDSTAAMTVMDFSHTSTDGDSREPTGLREQLFRLIYHHALRPCEVVGFYQAFFKVRNLGCSDAEVLRTLQYYFDKPRNSAPLKKSNVWNEKAAMENFLYNCLEFNEQHEQEVLHECAKGFSTTAQCPQRLHEPFFLASDLIGMCEEAGHPVDTPFWRIQHLDASKLLSSSQRFTCILRVEYDSLEGVLRATERTPGGSYEILVRSAADRDPLVMSTGLRNTLLLHETHHLEIFMKQCRLPTIAKEDSFRKMFFIVMKDSLRQEEFKTTPPDGWTGRLVSIQELVSVSTPGKVECRAVALHPVTLVAHWPQVTFLLQLQDDATHIFLSGRYSPLRVYWLNYHPDMAVTGDATLAGGETRLKLTHVECIRDRTSSGRQLPPARSNTPAGSPVSLSVSVSQYLTWFYARSSEHCPRTSLLGRVCKVWPLPRQSTHIQPVEMCVQDPRFPAETVWLSLCKVWPNPLAYVEIGALIVVHHLVPKSEAHGPLSDASTNAATTSYCEHLEVGQRQHQLALTNAPDTCAYVELITEEEATVDPRMANLRKIHVPDPHALHLPVPDNAPIIKAYPLRIMKVFHLNLYVCCGWCHRNFVHCRCVSSEFEDDEATDSLKSADIHAPSNRWQLFGNASFVVRQVPGTEEQEGVVHTSQTSVLQMLLSMTQIQWQELARLLCRISTAYQRQEIRYYSGGDGKCRLFQLRNRYLKTLPRGNYAGQITRRLALTALEGEVREKMRAMDDWMASCMNMGPFGMLLRKQTVNSYYHRKQAQLQQNHKAATTRYCRRFYGLEMWNQI